ncbi:MAG: AI-2E family transporter [Cyclobacteriaceae bacterium]
MSLLISKGQDSNARYLRTLQYVAYVSAVLYFGRTILIPLSFSLLISFILQPICGWLEKKGLSRLAAIITSMTVLSVLMIGLVALLIQQLVAFAVDWPQIRLKLIDAMDAVSLQLLESFNISKEQQNVWLKQLIDQSGGNLFQIIGNLISSYSFAMVLLILIPILSSLMLFYRHRLVKALYMLFPVESRVGIRDILNSTIKAYYNFIKGMGIVYLVVGILNSIGLLILGIPHAIFFGFVVAVLTFIPYIGIVVGSLLPISMAWITYNSVWYPIGVILIFAFVQYLEANIIFPLAVSNRLQINALATIVAILLGGLLWGVAGMILFVPFLAIIKLITDHSPQLKTWSTLLGTGKLN